MSGFDRHRSTGPFEYRGQTCRQAYYEAEIAYTLGVIFLVTVMLRLVSGNSPRKKPSTHSSIWWWSRAPWGWSALGDFSATTGTDVVALKYVLAHADLGQKMKTYGYFHRLFWSWRLKMVGIGTRGRICTAGFGTRIAVVQGRRPTMYTYGHVEDALNSNPVIGLLGLDWYENAQFSDNMNFPSEVHQNNENCHLKSAKFSVSVTLDQHAMKWKVYPGMTSFEWMSFETPH